MNALIADAKYRFLCLLPIVVLFCCYASAYAAPPCDPEVSRLISAQGDVDYSRAQAKIWAPAEQGQRYCGNDKLRTGALSRALLSLQEGIVTFLSLDQLTLINFVKNAGRVMLSVERGQVHIRSHTPSRFDISTPFINAGIEGTEFLVVANNNRAEITVFEGKVRVYNRHGEIVIGKGQTALGLADGAPILKKVDLNPDDAVRWALYYPPIIDFAALGAAANMPEIQLASERYQAGDILGAYQQLNNLSDGSNNAKLLALQAGLLLTVGQVDQAESLLEKARRIEPGLALIDALRAIIALSRNDKTEAGRLAQSAIAAVPETAIPLIAMSYVEQANFHLETALQIIDKAIAISPQNSLIHCRRAELLASLGEIGQARSAAETALALNPRLARVYVVLGFLELMETDVDNAIRHFQNAATLDASDPLAHFGLGLARIRRDDMATGKNSLEIAASLDPNDAILRSYLGKTYYEMAKYAIAKLQFDIAKAADPNDPTPHFYNAILLQSQNRPGEAIQEMETAISLNGNRAVNRSKQMLDSDRAARGAALGRIYNEVGFTPRALVHAWNALADDPGDYTAHRLLADSYNALPRSDFARISEMLQAQLLQPINITPVQPRLTESSQLLAGNLGPSALSLNEFNPVFERDRSLTWLSGLVGGNDTYSDEIVHAGIWKQLSYSLGQFHHQSAGYRFNNASDTNLYHGFIQASVTPSLKLQLEYKHKDLTTGYMSSSFFAPEPFIKLANDHYSSQLQKDNYRFGLNWALNPSSRILGSAIHFERKLRKQFSAYEDLDGYYSPFFAEDIHSRGSMGELQYQFSSAYVRMIAGAVVADIEHNNWIESILESQRKGYLYGYFQFPTSMRWTLGVNYSDLEHRNYFDNELWYEFHTRRLNPKFGLLWQIMPDTVLRLAAFKTTAKLESADQTIEPTQIAGFNQFFDDISLAQAERYGIGLDQNFGDSLKGGIEYSERHIKELHSFGSAKQRENQYRAYLLWLPHPNWIAGVDFFRERFVTLDNTFELSTQYIPVTLSYYDPMGWYARLKATHYRQEIDDYYSGKGKENAEFVDLTLGYRLPNRKGLVELWLQNLLDQNYRYQDNASRSAGLENTVLNPLPFPPSFTVSARFTLAF